jgi:hypothetical protein
MFSFQTLSVTLVNLQRYFGPFRAIAHWCLSGGDGIRRITTKTNIQLNQRRMILSGNNRSGKNRFKITLTDGRLSHRKINPTIHRCTTSHGSPNQNNSRIIKSSRTNTMNTIMHPMFHRIITMPRPMCIRCRSIQNRKIRTISISRGLRRSV